MDDKKLLQLHTWLKEQGGTSRTFDDFKAKVNSDNGKALHGFLQSEGYTDLDYDGFVGEYSAPTQPQTVVGGFMQSAQDLATTALQEKAKSDARNEQIAGDIKSEQVRQKPKYYYDQNVLQVQERFNAQGEPQNLQAVMSLYNPKPIDETDPLQVGAKKHAQRVAEVQKLLPTVKQETILGVHVNPVNLATKVNPDKVTDIGLTALKYAQEKELPNEIRDAIIKGDDIKVSNYLLLNDDNYRLNYADKQDIAQAESAYKRPVTAKDRMNLWQGRTDVYAKEDRQKYGEEADWLSPYAMLQSGDNTKLSEKLAKMKPLFENQDGSLYYDEELAKKDVIRKSQKLSSFNKPEEKLMAYYQILANRQKTLENTMNQKYANYAGRSQFELQNPGVLDRATTPFESALSDLQYGQIMGGALSYIGADFLSRPEAKEWYKNANQLNAIAKYIKEGGAQKEETWGDTFKGVWQDLSATERYAKGLNVDVISTARQDIGNIQRGVMSQLEITPTKEEADRLKIQANKGQGLFSADTYIGFAYQQAAIGTQLLLARSMTPTAVVPKIFTPLTNVSKGSTLGRALFSNTMSSKVANKIYSGLVGALGTGVEYQMVGALSGEEKGTSIRDEMTFGSGFVGSAGKSAAKPFTNWLGEVAGKRIGNAAKRVIGGGLSEIAEETPQTIYQAWEQKGGWEGIKEGVEEIIGKDDESTWRRMNKALGFFVSMGLGGYLDGGTSEELYEVMEDMIPDIEAASGEKVDKALLKEIVSGMQEGVKDKPVGINVTNNVANFQINGKEFNYTAEGGATSTADATPQEIELANQYGVEILKTHNIDDNVANIESEIRQNREQNAQNTEEAAPQEQEVAQVENAEIAQEPQDVEAEVEVEQPESQAPPQKTAEELDTESTEAKAVLDEYDNRVQALAQEISALESQIVVGGKNAPIYQQIAEKEQEKADIEKESTALADRVVEIATLRQTIKTKDEAIEVRKQEIDAKLQENETKGLEIATQHAEAIKNRDFATAEQLDVDAENLVAENEALAKEKEAMQPKKEVVKGPLTTEKEPVAEVETPIMAETPQLETPIAENKGEINPTPAEKVEKLQNMTTSEESVTEKDREIIFDNLYKSKEKILTKEDREKSNKYNDNLQKRFEAELQDGDTIISASGEELYYKDGVVLWKKDGSKYGFLNLPTMAILNGSGNAKIIHPKKETKTEVKQESKTAEIKEVKEVESKPQEKETPVAPAAPKEENNKTEKSDTKKKTLKERLAEKNKEGKPKKEAPTPPKKVNSGKELAEMLGNDEKAQETGKAWDKVAEIWAKKTGKTIADWWNRIESIQVGGEKAGTKGLVEIVNNKFVVFLASDRDVSTPMHELAHIFQTDLSASENKSVVDWYNEKNGTEHEVSDWGFAETDTSRKISEYFAEGFIEWLKEGGKTTDKAIQSVFSKFKEWLKGVVNSVFDAKVELNDDLRKIYEEIFTEKEKVQIAKRQKTVKVNEESIDPVELTWNYFAQGGKVNRQEILSRLKKRFGDKIPKDVLAAIEPFVEGDAPKFDELGEQLHSNLTDNNPEIYVEESEFVDAADAIFEEIGEGFSKVVTTKIKEYAAIKNQNQDEEAISAQAEDAIEQAKINRPSEAERLRTKYPNEIDFEIARGAGLFQSSSKVEKWQKWADNLLDGEINRDSSESEISEAREYLIEEMQDSDLSPTEIQDVADRAIYKLTAPLDAETVLSEHADRIEQGRNEIIEKERQSLPQDTIDALREEVKKIAQGITDSTTQEEVAQMQSETKDMLISKGMSQKDAQDLVNEFIRERSFGTKFRDNYAPQMSQELRDAVIKQTYFYRVVSNSAAIQKAQAKINEWYEEAIANVAQKWHDNGQKPDATNQDFIADTYEELMDIVNSALFDQKITADYYVKVAAAMYAIKLADTLVGNLTATAKKRVLDKAVILVNNLAELGTIFGRTINMFGVMVNVSGGVLQAIFKKEMSNIIANMSFSQKVNKDAIEAVLDGVADMVQGIANGTNKGLIQSLVDAMEGNKSVEKLLEKIVENATNEQDIIDILNKIDDLEIQKEALKKEIKDKLVLEAKIREKNKEIAQLRAALVAKKPATGTTNKNTQRQKSAAKTKYDSLIDEVVSFGKNLFSNSLYQTIEGFQTSMFTTYKPEVITKVNDIMKNIADFVYLGNENVSTEKLYEMVQDAARKEFAQKYLEKANIQPDVPLITGTDLTKAQEAKNKAAIAKNKEKENQKQLHKDILDAINNDHFKASIETYLQENQAKDIRAQMRKRVTGIVNDTNATPTEKKVELRKALVQMVGEAATSTNEAAKGIKDFMRTYFDVTGKDVTAFEAEFDKMWAAQVEKKQLDLIKKRLQTSAEKDAALTEKVINDLITHFKTNKEFGHKFSEDLAKNIRITEKNWTDETAKRFRDTYHIPISMAHNQKKIADMIKYIDTLPNGTDAKEMAMNVVMNEYLNIVGVSNLDRWVALVDVMFHVDNLLNIATVWQNIEDSLYQVAHDTILPVANFFGEVITAMIDKENFLTALSKAQKANWINSKVVFKTLFSQSTKRLAQNQFSLQEARAVGEYASFMDYFAKSFSELPSRLKNFKFNSVADFIQYGIPAVLMTAYDSTRLGIITDGLMSGPDLALGNTLQMGRMANILSRKGINSKEAMDLADVSTAGDRELDYGGKMQKISDILAGERDKGYFANQETVIKTWNEAIASGKTEEQAHNAIKQAIADGTIASDYKREWRRKMELFAEYVEQEHAAWIIADTYRKNATYKTDPTGLLGMAYQGITTGLIRKSRQNEMEAREIYNRIKTALNLAKQKGWQLAKLAAERILGGAYLRTKINLANKYFLNSFLGNLATHIKNNVGYMDTDAAMKLSVNDKGEITPNSLWYIDDLTNKAFLKEAENKLQDDIDKINESATKKKEAITEKEDAQIEKIDNAISDKEKALKERKAAIDKVSDKKQESIDKKIDKRKEIIDTFTKRIQVINDLFAEKEQKILDNIANAIAKIESKILDIEIKAVDKVSAKNAKIETKIAQYVRKRERLYAQSLLIDRKIESETSDFESMLLELNEQEQAISASLGSSEKAIFSDFVNKKRQELADLHGKKVAELTKKKAIKSAQIEEAITLFEFQLENYKNIYESSIDYIQRDVQRFVETAENNIKKVAASEDLKIQENSDKRDEAVQKLKDTQKQRVAAIDHELNVAINVEKEKYNRQKAYLDDVFTKEKAQLEQEKAVIARKAEADRKNINKLAADKAKPIIAQKAKIANKIASYDANYRIGYADEKARQVRIGITTALLLASYLFSSGDDDDEEKPIIEVVGDITSADGGTKASNQNSKEANSKKKLIIRAFGIQLSWNFMDQANVMDLLAWGEVFDHLARKKRGVVSDKSIVDVAARPMLTFMQQIFAFRDASTLDFTNPFKEPSENVLKAASNVSPVKMPAQVRQIIGDFIYNGQQYDLPDNETYFKQYLRLLGVHPEVLSTESAKYAVRYSMVNGQPLHQYTGDNSNEIDRLIATGIWGKETSTSFNDFTIKPDKANVLFKEMEFLSWLHDRGLTSAINITNPDDTAPKVADGILLGMNPMPVDEFQKNILKPTAIQASDKLRKMYKSEKFNGKTEKQIISSVKNLKSGEEAAKDYLESNKTDLAALNIGLKYITKDLWEDTKKEVLMKYLKEKKPNYKRPGESYTTYKNRVKLK